MSTSSWPVAIEDFGRHDTLPELGHQPRDLLGRGGGNPGVLGQPRTVCGVVPERLDERLVRRRAVLVGAPVEHERALCMRRGGEPRREARLADAGLAGQDRKAFVARGLLPERAQSPQRPRAADERPALAVGEHGRQRHWARRRAAGHEAADAPLRRMIAIVAIALYDTAVRDAGVQCLSALRYPPQGRPQASNVFC